MSQRVFFFGPGILPLDERRRNDESGAAADMVLHTRTGRRTAAGKAMQSATDAVDSAMLSVKHGLER